MLRVLFADDQIPHYDQEKDDRVAEELFRYYQTSPNKKKRAMTRDKVRAAYDHDREFFDGLVRYFQTETDVHLVHVQSHTRALQLVRDYRADMAETDARIDAAVVDLSWDGDPDFDDVAHGADRREGDTRRDQGERILLEIQRKAREEGVHIPTIVFSQNFYEQPELMTRVLSNGALPVPKFNRKQDEDKRETGYRALYSSIRHEVDGPLRHERREEQRISRAERDVRRARRLFEIVMVCGVVIIAFALALPLFVPELNADFAAVLSGVNALVGLGLFGTALKFHRDQSRDLAKMLDARSS